MRSNLSIICICLLSGCGGNDRIAEFSNVGDSQRAFFPQLDNQDKFDDYRVAEYQAILDRVEEPSLYRLSEVDSIACFRFLWIPSLDAPVVFRAWTKAGNYWVKVSRPEGFQRGATGVPEFGMSDVTGIDEIYPITGEQWEKLEALMGNSEIWRPMTSLQIALGESLKDGQGWFLEKTDLGSYASNRFVNPRVNCHLPPEERDYTPVVKCVEFLISILPDKPDKWERYGGGTMPRNLDSES